MATTTWLIRLESRMPRIRTVITSRERTTAGRSTTPSPADDSTAGTSYSVPTRSFCRYPEKPVARAADPIVNSSARSDPMIHATSSPNVA